MCGSTGFVPAAKDLGASINNFDAVSCKKLAKGKEGNMYFVEGGKCKYSFKYADFTKVKATKNKGKITKVTWTLSYKS